MRVGQLAAEAGVTVKAIHYYEKIGVLAPPQRTPSGYRDYDDGALERLTFIRAAQAIGLTLGEIRGIIAVRDRGIAPCAHVADLLQRRTAEIDDRIRQLNDLRGELRLLAARAESLDPADCEPGHVCHLIPR